MISVIFYQILLIIYLSYPDSNNICRLCFFFLKWFTIVTFLFLSHCFESKMKTAEKLSFIENIFMTYIVIKMYFVSHFASCSHRFEKTRTLLK